MPNSSPRTNAGNAAPRQTSMERRQFLSALAAGISLVSLPTMAQMEGTATAQSGVGLLPQIPQNFRLDAQALARARRRARRLVARMTIAEKVSQLGNTAPAIARLQLPAYQYWHEALHGLARSGPVTSFPVPLAMANSWNPELAERVYTAVSDEGRAYNRQRGTALAFYSPQTLNTAKDPRWGRIDETLGEDPYLMSSLVASVVAGMQGRDPQHLKTVCCAKHFIANETDDDRHVISATLDPRSFWEYYTRPFQAAVEAGVFTVMSAYNEVNGIPCSADHFLLTRLLRGHWGFQGYVTSDCDAVQDIWKTHHYVPTAAQAAALAMQAGCDLNCGFAWGSYQKHLPQALAEQLVSEHDIDRALTRLLSARFLMGEFDPPSATPWGGIGFDVVDSAAHRELAVEAARQTLVLLKNENQTLPLDKARVRKVLLTGPLAGRCALGGYSGGPFVNISVADGVAAVLGAPQPRRRIFASDAVAVSWELKNRHYMRPDGSVGNIENGDNLQLPAQDFTGKTQVRLRVASARGGGRIELRLDSLKGKLAASLDAPATGGWRSWREISAPLSASGPHSYYLVFKGQPHRRLMKLDWLELLPQSAAPAASTAVEIQIVRGCTMQGPANEAWLREAETAAKQADVVLAVVGADQTVAHEQHDRQDITLPGAQPQLLRRLHAANPQTIAILNTNSPLAIPWADRHLPAILCAVCAGQAQGTAIAEALFGDINPGGKLAETWYRGLEQLPSFHEFNLRRGRRTYMYFPGKPLYPFGYGLSYTRFTYSNLQLDARQLAPGGQLGISFDLENSGDRAGAEIAQLYVTTPRSRVQRPRLQLVGFARVELKPGERKTIQLSLPHHEPALWYWDETVRKYVLQPGTLRLAVGASSADLRLHAQARLKV